MVLSSNALRYNALVLLALVGLVVYSLWPNEKREFEIWPQISQPEILMPYSDVHQGGLSQVELQTLDSVLRIEFAMDARPEFRGWGGASWVLSKLEGTFRNWMRFDTLRIELRGEGLEDAMLKILTRDPDFTTDAKPDSWRVLTKEVPVTGQWVRLAIPVDHFYVPEWWYVQNRVPKDFSQKHLASVHAFEVGPNDAVSGGSGFMEIRSARLTGNSNRPFAYLFGYLFVLLLVALGTNPRGKRRK